MAEKLELYKFPRRYILNMTLPKEVRKDPREIMRAYAILKGRLIEKKTYTQIAKELGITRKTVYEIRQRPTYKTFLKTRLDAIKEKEKTRYIR